MSSKLKSAQPYTDIAERYANDVISGKIAACGYVRKACERHFRDREMSRVATFRYEYVSDYAEAVCNFIENLSHVKGRWAGRKQKFELSPWQCFIACMIFGWVRKKKNPAKKERQLRRFRVAYIEVPRKNGKSFFAAAIGLFMLTMDGEHGAEVYSGATSEKQAWEVFKPARMMALKDEEFADDLGVSVYAKSLVVEENGSTFAPIIGNPGDGAGPSCAIVDEFHEHDTPALYNAMETGMSAREQPLMLIITTAGANLIGPCHDKHDDVIKVLDQVLEEEDLFGIIYTIDEGDDPFSLASLQKANPNFGVSTDAEYLLAKQRNARMKPVDQATFKTKYLNIWCSVLSPWMNMEQWNKCADLSLDEDDFIGKPGIKCVITADLASKSDLCSEQRLYHKTIYGKDHFYLFGTYWLPEAAIEEEGPNKAHYEKWVKMDILTATDGVTVDFDLIQRTLVDDAKKRNPREFVYDPFNATQVAQALMAVKVTCVEFQQTPANFAVPMDDLLTAVNDGRYHHDGNPMTTWCMSNVKARKARKGLFAPTKEKHEQKIDGSVAAIMAQARINVAPPAPKKFQMFGV